MPIFGVSLSFSLDKSCPTMSFWAKMARMESYLFGVRIVEEIGPVGISLHVSENEKFSE